MPTEYQAKRSLSLFSGARRFLYGGEVHHFRLDPATWPGVLQRLREARMDSVSVYVPWNWHEPEPGVFDFSGATHPRRNLVRFLELCAEAGLGIHVRPGPWIQSEWRHGGVPDWLLREHSEILALDASGSPSSLDAMVPSVTYIHPVFLDHATRWFRALAPVLRERADDVVAIQLDDDFHYGGGVRSADPLGVDYNELIVGGDGRPGFYQDWLARRYREIGRLNEAYRTSFSSFTEVHPPRAPLASARDLLWFLDWHYMKEDVGNQYVEHMRDVLTDEGLDQPTTMVMPYMTPYGCRRFSDYFEDRGKPVLVTTQSYPALWTSGVFPDWAAGHVAAMMQAARGWNPKGRPLVSAETQASFGFHLTAEAMEPFYALLVAQGLSGISFCMLVGGDNPTPWGMSTGRSYDLGAAVGPDASLRPHFAPIRRLGQFLETHGEALLATEPLLDMAVGYYPPYETASQQGDALLWGARHQYREVLGQVFGLASQAVAHNAGVLSLLTSAGYTYGMLDLERASLDELRSFRQLWCLGLDFMSREVQAKLIHYVEAGGYLVMLPQVPHLGSDMKSDEYLRERIGGRVLNPVQSVPLGPHRIPWHLLRVGDVGGFPVSDIEDEFDLAAVPGAEPIAVDERTGAVCGYEVHLGKGSAAVLGFKPRFGWDSHDVPRAFIRFLASRAGIVAPIARAEGSELLVVERTNAESAFVFVINVTTWAQRARITYRHPRTGASVTMPRLVDALQVPTQGALIMGVELPVPGSDVRLAYSTSQVQSWKGDTGAVELELYGPSGTLGETALRLSETATITIDGEEPLQSARQGEETIVVYRHADQPVRLRAEL